MWHMPIKVGIFAVTAKVLGTGLLPMWGAAVLSFTVSLTIALLCYRYFEMPIRQRIVAFSERGRNGHSRAMVRRTV
jgi:peptidoglycan/LPS O-acetylase OafA/YrhL